MKYSKRLYAELIQLANKFDESGLEKEANLVDSFLIQIAQTDDEGHVCKDADKDGACDICGCDSFKVECAQCGDTMAHKIGGEDGIITRSNLIGATGGGVAGGVAGATKWAGVGGVAGTVIGAVGVLVGAIPGGQIGSVVAGGTGAVIQGAQGVQEGDKGKLSESTTDDSIL